jgi:hypothetical protein
MTLPSQSPEAHESYCDFCESFGTLGRVVFVNPTLKVRVCTDCVTVMWSHIQRLVIDAHEEVQSETRH